MMRANVKTLLLLTILVTAALPLIAALYFVDDALQTSLDLGFNREIAGALEDSSRNLRKLKTLDSAREDVYRAQFAELESLRQVYAEPDLLKANLLGSLKIYFAIGVLAAMALASAVAFYLSRRIAVIYSKTFDELTQQQERVRYLEGMSSWQEMAKMLAHEIKNPLTPIEVLITSLSKSFSKKSAEEFREQLTQTERMVGEELGHLKNTVVKFSEFARLPHVTLARQDLRGALTRLVGSLAGALDADIELQAADSADIHVGLDTTLFRQVLTNIVRNGIEANPTRRVRFSISLSAQNEQARVLIENDGVPVAHTLAARIFDPYVSGKAGSQNMGLGLAIVKKIVIEHGGDIAYVERNGHPGFLVSLPRLPE
jgi:signal transduction histidine kinase